MLVSKLADAIIGPDGLGKLRMINNQEACRFLAEYVELCTPEKIFVSDGSPKDLQYIRDRALELGEERKLLFKNHTIHFDSYHDQGRDKKNTCILVPSGTDLGYGIVTKERTQGIAEVKEIMHGIMKGKELFVLFYSLGPANSIFSIPCIQLTDSAYVAHNENLLYNQGYNEFVKRGDKGRFFKFVHSQGELDARRVCKNIDKRRIYIDLESETVFSANTQYGGNSIGLKKLAMRLSMRKAAKEGWLLEHMFVMGVHGPKSRKSYVLGAFPSMCGKTSTVMLEGESIIGDDIAMLKKKNGKVYAVNVENGMFGIIQGVNSKDDPALWKALHSENEIIFSNVLTTEEGKIHWIGKDGEVPEKGENHSGEWFKGKKDFENKEILCSHPNARFTLNLGCLENLDQMANHPDGVEVAAIVYGGRDSDTSVPIEQAFGWEHGITTKGAAIESETTAATLGKEGVREFNPMSNLDFLSVPVGQYVKMNLEFGKGISVPIFSVNYFLRGRDGKFLNHKLDKRIWYKWIDLRVNGEAGALRTPTGLIPEHKDLERLFKSVLNRDYTQEEYVNQFSTRVLENIAKIDRLILIYKTKAGDTPPEVFKQLEQQKERLETARKEHGNYISPLVLKKE